MKIYSMTATFGKLENETLTLQPGLNILHAPNEWGKSTWCAFLVSMLYGIETRVHTTKSAIADKERYAPWSGAPMAGRIDLNWNGRDITIERSSKGRSVFGVFRAYETETGLEVPELTAANCGQMLLGVEKSVFLRSGFLKLTDLPVTQDEALRRRLNAIVTTGDESGTADALGQTLKDLKNRCRLNKSIGLLPQAEAQQSQLQSKLTELTQLQSQSAQMEQRLKELEQRHKALLNHKAALRYEANRTYQDKLAAAEIALSAAQAKEQQLAKDCENAPSAEETERTLLRLRQLRDQKDALHMELQMLPAAPQPPRLHPAFQTADPDQAVSQAVTDALDYEENRKKKAFPWYCIFLFVIGAAFCSLQPRGPVQLLGILPIIVGGIFLWLYVKKKRSREKLLQDLLDHYSPLPPEQWEEAARSAAADQKAHVQALTRYEIQRKELEGRMITLQTQISAATEGRSLVECEQRCSTLREQWAAYATASKETMRAKDLVQALRSAHREATAPDFPDSMTYTESETARLLSDCAYEQRQLQQQLGHCNGRMEALGSEAGLRQQLDAVTKRIRDLELTYSALEIAQSTLSRASAELQRRFAPKISKRAQELFGQLTDGRYTRLTLGEDLSIHAGTDTEATLHSALWRSEGTIDQLYLALRLAVAEALTPEAPLVLDDALVRFDDQRLAKALEVLAAEAESKQVILFTCQTRETNILHA